MNVKDHSNKIKSFKNYTAWSKYKAKIDRISLSLTVKSEPYLPNVSVNGGQSSYNGHQVDHCSCTRVRR